MTISVLRCVPNRRPAQRKKVSTIGLCTLTIGLVTASFATHVIHLVLTQGLLYGVGGALIYNPFIFYLDEWFVKRKGLAYGIFWAGTGVFSSVMPFIMHWALNRYGFRTPLRVWAVFVMRDCHHLLKLPDFPDNYIVLNFRNFDMLCQTTQATSCQKCSTRVELGFLKTRLFWAFQAGNIVEGFGYFGPQIYLPSMNTNRDFNYYGS